MQKKFIRKLAAIAFIFLAMDKFSKVLASQLNSEIKTDKNFENLLKSLEPAQPYDNSKKGLSKEAEATNSNDDQEGGNWYEKLHWWKKAKPAYESMKDLIDKIKNIKKELSKTKISVDEQMAGWHSRLKVSVEELKERAQNKYEEILERQQALQDVNFEELTDDEKAEFNQITDTLKELDEVKNQLELLATARTGFNQGVENIANEQLRKSENYLDKALDSFEKIEQVFDDQNARILYEKIENSQDNVQAIYSYMQNNLKSYVNQISIKIKQLSQSLSGLIDSLEKKKIILRTQTPQEIEEQLLQEKKIAEQKAKAAKEAMQKELAQLSWWQRLKNWFAAAFGY